MTSREGASTDGPPLQSDGRICLRPLSLTDADAHLLGCDEEIIERLCGGQRPSPAQVAQWLEINAVAWTQRGPVVDVGIIDVASGVLCGCVGIQRGLDYLAPGKVNVTYALYPAWRGRGYASRAVKLALNTALEQGPVREFVIRVAPENAQSSAVAERSGFTYSRTTDDRHGRLNWWSHRL